jgi:Cft2 family RNA processing exonuclease
LPNGIGLPDAIALPGETFLSLKSAHPNGFSSNGSNDDHMLIQSTSNLAQSGGGKETKADANTRKPAVLKLWVLGSKEQRISSYLVQMQRDDGTRVNLLLDAGGIHGAGASLAQQFPAGIKAKDIDAVIISHGHQDHWFGILRLMMSGLSPACRIYCTPETMELIRFSFRNSGKRWLMSETTNHPAIERVDACLTAETGPESIFAPLNCGHGQKIVEGVTIEPLPAGHFPGAIISIIEFDTGSKKMRLCYTADMGGRDHSYLSSPKMLPKEAAIDYLVIGAPKLQKSHLVAHGRQEFAELINQAYARASPSAEKTGSGVICLTLENLWQGQTLLSELVFLQAKGAIPHLPVYSLVKKLEEGSQLHERFLRSPQAEAAFKAEILRMQTRGVNPFRPVGFCSLDAKGDEFARIASNQGDTPVIVISFGDSKLGRAVQKSLLGSSQNTVIYPNFRWLEAAKKRLLGIRQHETIHPNALRLSETKRRRKSEKNEPAWAMTALPTGYLDDHANLKDLRWWLGKSFPGSAPRQTYIVHGGEEAKQALARALFMMNKDQRWVTRQPNYGDSLELPF